MATGDRNQEPFDQRDVTEEYSFDEMAKGVANGTISRFGVLKLVSAALLGGVLGGVALGLNPDDAYARRRRDPDLCTNPYDPSVDCEFTTSCSGCEKVGGTCRTSACGTGANPRCAPAAEGKNICVSLPAGATCTTLQSCTKSSQCGTGRVCVRTCCNAGDFKCLPRCSSAQTSAQSQVVESQRVDEGSGEKVVPTS